MAAPSATPTSRIFIRGLPPSITEAELRKHLSTIRGGSGGDVTDVKLIPQRRIGYVGYKNPEDAAKAVKYFNKSYVRMSKISVEPAKAISDPSLSKSRGRDRDVGSGTGPPSAKRKSPEGNAEDNTVSKRRKGEETRSDPKLSEFLEVMGSAKESALAKGPTEEPPMAQVNVPEDESDDEYEQIPSKRDTPKKAEQPPKPQPSKAQPKVSKVAERAQRDAGEDQGKPDSESEQDPDAMEDAPAPAATDDDWLRSRTNRLLDLMDPDELPQEQAEVSKSSQPHRDGEASTEESQDETPQVEPQQMQVDEPEEVEGESTLDTIRRTSRLFVRNLPYGATKEDIAHSFEKFGTISEIHIAANKAGTSKGFCFIVFAESSDAVDAFQSMDGATFQGRIIHIIPASAKRGDELDEFEISKLPLKKQNLIRKRQKAASTTFNWNSLYMNQDAVNESVANRLGVSKSEMLDPTSSDAAVKQAIAETSVIQDTKAYFVANGVDIDAFKSHRRGDTAILVKNFPYGTTIDELRTLFEESGPVLKVLMPPSGTIAIVLFAQANHAKTAFERLAYRRMKSSMLFLEKAPKDLFPGETSGQGPPAIDRPTGTAKLNANELLSGGDNAGQDEVVDTTSLFVRNLNFDTTTSGLADACSSLDGFVSARVKTKKDPKKPGKTLSMGFGFVEFRSKEQAHEALQILNGYVLDGHTLTVKASHRGLDAAEERKRDDKAKKAAGQRTKIIIKNLPFQASKKDIRALFGTYGQLRSVRVPKKMDHTARGFAFADFVTPREAENALNSLKDTHLLGRKLVLDFAEAEAVDAEEEIEKMQRKVGGQANKMALQQLTGKGRKKVNIGDNNEDDNEG